MVLSSYSVAWWAPPQSPAQILGLYLRMISESTGRVYRVSESTGRVYRVGFAPATPGTSNETEPEKPKKRLQFVTYCIHCFVA
jgi:hypothetical protein